MVLRFLELLSELY